MELFLNTNWKSYISIEQVDERLTLCQGGNAALFSKYVLPFPR